MKAWLLVSDTFVSPGRTRSPLQLWPAVRPLVAARGGLAWCGGAVVYRCSCAATHRGGARPSGACCTPPCCVPCGPTGTRRDSRGGARRPIGQRVDLLRLALLQGVRDQESQSGTLKIQGQGPRRVACLCDERAARIGMRSVFIYERRRVLDTWLARAGGPTATAFEVCTRRAMVAGARPVRCAYINQ